MRFILRATLICLAVVGCLSTSVSSPQLEGQGRRVLFVGNSYTYVNDVPGIVQALADSAHGETLAVETVAEPDFALIDHWSTGVAAREIKKGWAFVVLQQGPSSVEVNRDTLRLAAKLFAPGISQGGGKAALFSAWPTVDRRVDFPRAIESYRLAAQDVNGVFLPVASAWLAAWSRDATLPLYAGDGLHASSLGSYLTALVIYAKLMNHPAVGLPSTLRLHSGATLQIPPATARLLQEAADESIAKN